MPPQLPLQTCPRPSRRPTRQPQAFCLMPSSTLPLSLHRAPYTTLTTPRPPVLPSSLFYFGVFLHLVPAHRAWLPGPGKAGTVHVSAGAVTGKRVVSLRVPACSPPIASLRRRMARSWQSVLFLETARTLVFPLEITGGTSAGSTVVPIIPPSL